jgi:hypothetical protein
MKDLPGRSRWLALLMMLTPGGYAVASPCSSLEPARWLIGSWLASGDERTVHETWRAVSEATFEGEGQTRSRSDDRLLDGEVLRLVLMDGEVFYLAKVAHNPLPVSFRLVACQDDRLVFENPAHDFPRRIEYRRTGPETFEARVSDGGSKGFTLDFRRAPTR